jgi:SAM-dependent methyltransferase
VAKPDQPLTLARPAEDDRAVWEAIWGRSGLLPPRDYLSERLFEEITSIAREVPSRRVMEAGSGSGRICARLAAAGADVYLLDRSRTALLLARRVLAGRRGHYLCGDVSALPFRDRCFDIVFSSGVMEHWTIDEQRDFLAGAARVVPTGGVFLAFNPYARSVVYRVGKAILEAAAMWPYGDEHPVRSLAEATPGEWELAREYSIGFLALVLNSCRLVPVLRRLDGPVQAVAVGALEMRIVGAIVRALDAALSRVFGGYLLVSVLVRK